MKSFSILRTNVGLTTNVKVVVDSSYNLYLESINSIPELEIDRLKKMQFNKNNFYDELVPYFFRNIPIDVAYEVKFDDDKSMMFNNFENQYDDIYQMGARNISNNKDYSEEYEYFAPIYIFKQNIPNYFVIFRIDGPGLENLSSSNFRELYLKKLKTVKVFDLTKKTQLGEWIDRNFRKNKSFPTKSLEVDFRNLEFTKWHGIDYDSGGYTSKSRFMDESLEDENTLFDLEKSFYDGYQVNRIIFPHIINFNFLFDDTPATPNSLRKWSLNRYVGFYIDDMETIDKITPFSMQDLKFGFQILDGNILYHPDGDPFVNGYQENKNNYVEFEGDFFIVEKFEQLDTKRMVSIRENRKVSSEEYTRPISVKYRIISDKNLSGKQSSINTKRFTIDSNLRILNSNLDPFEIDGFNLSDINLIEIDGVYHNLILEDGYIKIITDYGMSIKEDYRFEYFINSPDPNYYNYIDLQGSPISFRILRIKFTEIKDFDLQIIDSKFANYEYELSSSLSKTEEPKMYTTDFRSNKNPSPLNDYIYNGQVENIPVSSDYTANLETFRILNRDLSDIWRKNSIHCRWGYQNSLSASDYPYLLNNNEIHGEYNRTVDTNLLIPFRPSRNLDYFYSINSGSTNYMYHSLHIERNFGESQDISFRFELDKYLNTYTMSFQGDVYTYSLNYFDYLFDNEINFMSGKITQNSKKYSLFESGDGSEPNTTLFRGIKFKIFEVDSLKSSNTNIENINVKTSNYFEDWKLSILLSNNSQGVNESGEIYDIGNWGYFIDNLYYNNQVAFFTSTQSSPTNIEVGDVVEIKQFYPFINQSYNTKSNVTYVGILGTYSGVEYYGFATEIPWGESTPANPGFYRVMTQWKNIKNWELNNLFESGDIVLYDDVLYDVLQNNLIQDPVQNPTSDELSSIYSLYQGESPFWNPSLSYIIGDWVYRDENYWIKATSSQSFVGNFWSPTFSYSTGDVVIYMGDYYRARNGQVQGKKPKMISTSIDITSSQNVLDWELIWSYNNPIWEKVQIWNPILNYDILDYVIYNDVLYRCQSNNIVGIPPIDSPDWERIYSMVPDTNFNYGTQSNPFLKMNNGTYLCSFNRNFSLDNGIVIYINKKWKNILINIAINDNTSFDIDNIPRDKMYSIINSRLTAANFIRQINDLDSKYGFVDYTSYIIIEEDGSIKKYQFGSDISNLPYILTCDGPDEVEINNNSIKYKPISLDENIIKPINSLKNGNIDNLNKINHYNLIPLAYEIEKNLDRKENLINYNGLLNTGLGGSSNLKSRGNFSRSRPIYRHSGPYMPVFYDIDLFDRKICEFESLFSIRYETETLESIGNIDQNFNIDSGFDGRVYKAIIDDQNNKIILNGDFTSYQGLTCGGVCKINFDGSPDIGFIENIGIGLTGGNVRGLCLQYDGKILIGGQFQYFNGLTFSSLIRLNYDGSVDTTFNPDYPMFSGTPSVYEIQQQSDGKIICAGGWNFYQGATVSSGLIRLMQNGDIDTSFDIGSGMVNGGSNAVYSCYIQSDGKIIGGGIFTNWDGNSVQNIVRVNQDGTFDTSFDPNNSGLGLNAITLGINQQSDGKIYLGGAFSQFGTFSSSKLVRINQDGTFDTGFTSPFSGGPGGNSIESIDFQENNKIILGGSEAIDTEIFRLNLDGSVDSTFTASFFGGLASRSYVDNVGKVLFIGAFTESNTQSFNRIVRFDVERTISQINEVSECPKFKFNENLTFFGIIKQRIISKINRKENLLKLRNLENYNSIYPMLDEFGYTTSDFFIFKSTWDFEYYIETGKGTSIQSVGSLIQSPSVQTILNNLPSVDISDTPQPITPTGGGIVVVNPVPEVPGPVPNPGGGITTTDELSPNRN